MVGNEQTVFDLQERVEALRAAMRGEGAEPQREYIRLANAPWNTELLVEACFDYLRQRDEAREKLEVMREKVTRYCTTQTPSETALRDFVNSKLPVNYDDLLQALSSIKEAANKVLEERLNLYEEVSRI